METTTEVAHLTHGDKGLDKLYLTSVWFISCVCVWLLHKAHTREVIQVCSYIAVNICSDASTWQQVSVDPPSDVIYGPDDHW